MGVTPVEFKSFSAVTEDVAKQVKAFLLGEGGDERNFERKTSVSSSGSEERFYPNTEKRENVEGWNDWGENDDDLNEQGKSYENDESPWNWLFRCNIRTWSDAEYILVTWESRFVVLSKTPNDKKYKILCKQWIAADPISSEITGSAIFGVASQRHTDQLDFLIIALGTLDGHVYFYTEKGTMLFFERFSIYEPVANVTFDCVRNSQFLLVVFSKNFFVIDTNSLHSVLHQAKGLIAKSEKSVEEVSESLELKCVLIDPDVKSNILHVIYTGLYKPSSFEQYNAATWQSFNSRVERPSLPTYSTFLVTCEKTFVSFVWHDSEEADQIWNEAIKYGKSLLPSFGIRKYFGISTEPVKKAPHQLSAQHAPIRSQILDQRIAQYVSKSPDSRYVAIVDRMARVLVIDVISRTMALMFKGYRDASISWISTQNDTKMAQFLAIFAPRRALLEVWTVLGNVRVCASHVSSSECDLFAGGEARILCGKVHQHSAFTSFFVDENGEFHQIIVPFHLALNGRASQNQHDHLLMKQIEKLDSHTQKWFDTFTALKLTSSRRTAFQAAISKSREAGEAHDFLAKLRTHAASKSLGTMPNEMEKKVAFYGRILDGGERKRSDEETTEFEMEVTVKKVAECHFGLLERDESSKIMPLGEWLTRIDFEETATLLDIFSNHWNDETRLRLAELLYFPIFESDRSVEEIHDIVVEKMSSILAPKDFVKLLGIKIESCEMNWAVFDRIVKFLAVFEEKEKGVIDQLDQKAMNSKRISESIVLMLICWSCRKYVSSFGEKEEKESEEEDWDAVSPKLEHLDSMFVCLHGAYLSNELLGDDEKKRDGKKPRIADLAQRIDSYCRENVAKWIVDENQAELKFLNTTFPIDPTETLGDDEVVEYDIDIPKEANEIISRIQNIMPRSFEHDLVVVDVCWEMMTRWFREPNANFELLSKCLKIVGKSIIDLKLRHGIARLIWDKFIASSFENLVIFIDKSGRSPKEKETRKEARFSETRVTEFFVESSNLLEILMNCVRDLPTGREFKADVVVEMSNSSFLAHLNVPVNGGCNRQDQLWAIAMKQQLVNYYLVMHHFHLAVAVRLQLASGIRYHALRSLFCAIGKRAFFVRLDSHPLIPLDRVDDGLMEKRHAFLTKIAEQGSTDERRLAKVLENEWNLTVNAINFMQALSAYRLGNDRLAEKELVACVRDDHAASALARVLAARIVQKATDEKTILTPTHSSYLCSLAGDETARVELYDDENDENHRNPKNWSDAIMSLGASAILVAQNNHSAVPFVKLNDIAKQYWGIRWMN